jgi:7-cyano-7-deazaguanine synthase in queuosine biosynthesis
MLILFDYGQMSFEREYESAQYYSRKYDVDMVSRKLDMVIPDSIAKGVDGSDRVTFRNLIMFCKTVNLFYPGFTHYGIGAAANDTFTDGSDTYWEHVELLFNLENKKQIKIFVPMAGKSQEEIPNEIAKRGLDLSHVWYCMRNGKRNCGECSKCRHVISKHTTKEAKELLSRYR